MIHSNAEQPQIEDPYLAHSMALATYQDETIFAQMSSSSAPDEVTIPYRQLIDRTAYAAGLEHVADIYAQVQKAGGQDVPVQENSMPVVVALPDPLAGGRSKELPFDCGVSVENIARIVAPLAVGNTDRMYSQTNLRDITATAPASVSRTISALRGQGLIEDGSHIRAGGRPAIEIVTTKGFDEELEGNPDWQRATTRRKLMDKLGCDEAQLDDYLLNLGEQVVRQAYPDKATVTQ